MPVYEYECESCGGRFEAIQKFSDPAVSECSLCHAKNVKKVLSTPAFVLKGTGWYITDYASQDRKKAVAAEKSVADAKPGSGCAAGACAGGACSAKTGS